MGDPRVTAIPVSDNGEELIDVRDHGLRVSTFRADDSGDFALVRAGLAARLLQAAEVLPQGVHLLLIEGYRPPALQRRYFDDYRSSLREASPDSDEEHLRILASRYVSPPEIAPHSAGAAIDQRSPPRSRARQLPDRVVALELRRPVLGDGNGRSRRGLCRR